ETMKDVLTEALDVEGLLELLNKMMQQEITCLAVDTPTPSVFSHEILNANPYAFLDDAPLEERRARAVEMRRVLPESVLQEVGKLDPNAILEVQNQAWPDIRNADEFQDALQTFIAFPEHKDLSENWQTYFAELIDQNRVAVATISGERFWFAIEKEKTFFTIYPHAILKSGLKEIESNPPIFDEVIITMLRGWLLHLGPTTQQEL